MFSYVMQIAKRKLVLNPATPIHGLNSRSYSSVLTLNEFKLKQSYLRNIKIYSTGLIKDPVNDYETLKLFNDFDDSLKNKDKSKTIQCIEKFIRNDNGIYNAEYGKSKQQLGDILYSYRKNFKVTPLDILNKLGFDKEELLNMGVLETTLLKTKTCVSSTVFEILVMDTLPEKFKEIQKVYYCQDGAVLIKCINLTGQTNHDFVIEFKNEKNEIIRIAFDSKVLKFDTYIKNLELRGLKYQIITLGNISDLEVKKNIVFHKAISDFSKEDKTFLLKSKMIKDSNINLSPEYAPEDILESSFITTMFVNTDDISKNLDKKKAFRLKNNEDNFEIDSNDFD